MKSLLTISLLAITAFYLGCTTPGPVEPVYDVVLKNDETGSKFYGPAANDLERCGLFRQALKDAKPNDTILLAGMRFDCDGKNNGTVRMPVNVIGVAGTHLYSNVWSDDQGCAFEIESATYSHLKIENQSWQINEDGRTLCFWEGLKRTDDNKSYAKDASGNKIYENQTPGPFTATVSNSILIGNAWVVYSWDGRGHTWNIKDTTVISGRQGISMMSGGGNFQNLNAERVTFDIDTMRSQDIGATSNGNPGFGGGYGLVVRGGNAKCTDCVFNMKCGITPHPASFVPRCVPIFDGDGFGSASSPWTYITVTRPVFNVDGRGSKDVYDLFFSNQGAKDKLQLIEMPPNYTKNW